MSSSPPGEWASRGDVNNLQLKRFSVDCAGNVGNSDEIGCVSTLQQAATENPNSEPAPCVEALSSGLEYLAQQLANLNDPILGKGKTLLPVADMADASVLTVASAPAAVGTTTPHPDSVAQNLSSFAIQRFTETARATPHLEVDLVPIRSATPPATVHGRLAPLAQNLADISPLKRNRSPATAGTAARATTSPKRDGRIKVVVRKRPLKAEEEGQDCVRVDSPAVQLTIVKQRVDLSEYNETTAYTFDAAFGEDMSNAGVHQACTEELLDVTVNGGSASCFAYGQTGSGKTYTMIGGDGSEKGLYLLGATDLFARLTAGQSLLVAFYEIYCNSLFDLLNNRFPVVLREDHNRKVNICGLSWREVTSPEDLWTAVNAGMEQRRTGSTSANEHSSRSHAVLSIRIHDINAPDFAGTLNYVDLAGSERAADTANNDRQTRLEGAEINKSLLALKECIRALDEKKRHVPFRGSRLTEVLRDSFTGISKTVMIANLSPSSSNFEHTANTLRYAFRVKGLSIASVAPSKARNAPRPFLLGPRSRSNCSNQFPGNRVNGSSLARRAEDGLLQRSPAVRRVRSPSGNRDNPRQHIRQKMISNTSAVSDASVSAQAADDGIAVGDDVCHLPPLAHLPASGSASGCPASRVDVNELERKIKHRIMKQLQEDLSRELQQVLDERDIIISNLRRENEELRGELKRVSGVPPSSEERRVSFGKAM